MSDSITPPASELPDMISVDDHIMEPKDLWQQQLPPSMRERGPRRRGAPRTGPVVITAGERPQ